MKLYNTLTRKINDFQPLNEEHVGIYSCGPTVYDNIHIGNLSAFIVADTLRRVLEISNDVKHVMNFTDVDDKTIRRSQEKYPQLEPMAALSKLTEEYSQIFLQDMESVGNDVRAITFVKATDSIEQMQALIRTLYDKKFAYVADDGVYFSIKAYKDSGKIYGQLTEITASSTSEARIANDEYGKASPHDFALWKKQKPGEPAWDFELDGQDLKGRPGWHVECSAMSTTALGQPFDIHTGGVDLIFPHHENEIAQSTAGKDVEYARLFVHNEHLLVDGNKMSKSLSNFFTIKDITDKGYSPLAFRLLVLQAHYRNQAHFSWKNIEAAANRLKDLRAMADLRWQLTDTAKSTGAIDFVGFISSLNKALTNDLDTPQALTGLSAVSHQLLNRPVAKDQKPEFEEFLNHVDKSLGLKLLDSQDISQEQKQLIENREKARANNDWQTSDKLRDKLRGRGIEIRDTEYGPIWNRA